MAYEEADLLISSVLKACIELPSPNNIVEIGSYHGKSTVVLGHIVKAFFPKSKVYAIDPHQGIIDATGLHSCPPSLDAFNSNIANSGLSEVVELIADYSYNVHWENPISLIFIDGLHDYENVSRDFRHFAEHILEGGYIAFHDYANYAPDVMTFVNELLSSNTYQKICQVNSLIVLQKEKNTLLSQ